MFLHFPISPPRMKSCIRFCSRFWNEINASEWKGALASHINVFCYVERHLNDLHFSSIQQPANRLCLLLSTAPFVESRFLLAISSVVISENRSDTHIEKKFGAYGAYIAVEKRTYLQQNMRGGREKESRAAFPIHSLLRYVLCIVSVHAYQ